MSSQPAARLAARPPEYDVELEPRSIRILSTREKRLGPNSTIADVFYRRGDWAVTRTVSGIVRLLPVRGYSVTHIPTGKCVPVKNLPLRKAKRMCDAFDWFKFKTDRSKAYRDGCARAAEICKRFDPEAK